jgi:hypothetical protein
MGNLEITVVQDLKYDLFSAVNAAKQGLTSVIDFDIDTGKNNSYTVDKITGNVTGGKRERHIRTSTALDA